jgi:hypothetical protein
MNEPSLQSFKSDLMNDLSQSDDENSDPKAKADNPKAKADDAQEDSMEFYDRVKPCVGQNHSLVLKMFRKVLNKPGWPGNDPAEPQHIVPSNDVRSSMLSSSKRSRHVAEESGVYVLPPPAKQLAPA